MNPDNSQPDETVAMKKLETDLQSLEHQPTTPQPTPVVMPAEPEPSPPIIPSVIPSQTNASIPETPKKNSSLVIIAIVLAVVAVLAVIVYVFAGKFLNVQPTPTPISTPVVIITPSPTPDVTADWKTYTNTAFGYSFKYPTDTEVVMLYVDKSVIPNPTPLDKSSTVWFMLNSGAQITVSIRGENTINKGDINYKLDNFDASRNTGESHGFYDFVTVTKSKHDYSIGLESSSGDQDAKIFNQFLSTFKFIEAAPVASATP